MYTYKFTLLSKPAALLFKLLDENCSEIYIIDDFDLYKIYRNLSQQNTYHLLLEKFMNRSYLRYASHRFNKFERHILIYLSSLLYLFLYET